MQRGNKSFVGLICAGRVEFPGKKWEAIKHKNSWWLLPLLFLFLLLLLLVLSVRPSVESISQANIRVEREVKARRMQGDDGQFKISSGWPRKLQVAT